MNASPALLSYLTAGWAMEIAAPLHRRRFFSVLACAFLFAMAPDAFAQARVIQQQVLHLHAEDGRDVAALLTMPAGGMNLNAPAIIHCQGGPGATPLEGSGVWIAEGLAARGYTVIAPSVRHSEQLLTFDFAGLNRDVKAAVDMLHSLGFRKITSRRHVLAR